MHERCTLVMASEVIHYLTAQRKSSQTKLHVYRMCNVEQTTTTDHCSRVKQWLPAMITMTTTTLVITAPNGKKTILVERPLGVGWPIWFILPQVNVSKHQYKWLMITWHFSADMRICRRPGGGGWWGKNMWCGGVVTSGDLSDGGGGNMDGCGSLSGPDVTLCSPTRPSFGSLGLRGPLSCCTAVTGMLMRHIG